MKQLFISRYAPTYYAENVDKMYQRANEKLKALNNIDKVSDNNSNSLQILLTQINQTNKL
jgi:hypothetical protein